jgi:hypothetical protein
LRLRRRPRHHSFPNNILAHSGQIRARERHLDRHVDPRASHRGALPRGGVAQAARLHVRTVHPPRRAPRPNDPTLRGNKFTSSSSRAGGVRAGAADDDFERPRGPPGAQRDAYRGPNEYDYDYAPPRGGRAGAPGGWDDEPPRGTDRGGPPGGGIFNNNGGGPNGGGGGNRVTNFLVAGAFIVGMGAGVAFDTSVNLEPTNVASRDILDRQTPSSEVCMANGASAMVFDQRVFLSLNPFNIYVSQPEVKPGCVLRRSNWSILEREKLVNSDQEADCKRNMNTFAFVGDLDKSPEVSCVYHSEEAENQYMKDPKRAVLGDGNQPRDAKDYSNKSFR